jgi:hypothetical protein
MLYQVLSSISTNNTGSNKKLVELSGTYWIRSNRLTDSEQLKGHICDPLTHKWVQIGVWVW